MKQLFDTPQLLTLFGDPFSDLSQLNASKKGDGCSAGCEGGCNDGCSSGSGSGF